MTKKELFEKFETLRDALEEYADKSNWVEHRCEIVVPGMRIINSRCGKIYFLRKSGSSVDVSDLTPWKAANEAIKSL